MTETLPSQSCASANQLPINEMGQVQPEQTLDLRRRFFTSSVGRLLAGAATVTGLAAGGAVVEAAPAHADTAHVYTITGTGGDGVWLHGDPGLGDHGDLITTMPEGTRFNAECYVNDTPVNGNPAWLYGTDDKGNRGYFTDYYSSSRWNRHNTLERQGLPICGEQSPVEEDSPEPLEDMLVSISYDREAAVGWARDHAKDTPPYDASCTQFVSRALWAGGLPKDERWTDQGEFGRIQKRPGTKSAWAVDHLQAYINYKYPQTQEIVLDGQRFRNNAVPEATIGDVILYDWEGDGEVDHATIVTDVVGNHYPEVAEWSIYDGREPTPYIERGWTWSEKSQTWLQTKNPNIIAYLLDIDTTQTGEF